MSEKRVQAFLPQFTAVDRFRRAAVTVVLTLQVTVMVITLRYSKTTTQYLNSTAVLLAEALKMLICLSVLAWQHGSHLPVHLRQELLRKPRDLTLVSVPALLYLLQNNLLFFAMEHLEAVIYQVTYQLKILTTAICMVLLLGKRLTCQQWASLFLLAAGVALAQGGSESMPSHSASAREDASPVDEVTEPPSASPTASGKAGQLVGFIALIVACLTSGFAGVYTERLLKQGNASLWLRNVQLGVWSLVVGAVALCSEASTIREKGFFQGYTWVVWCVVLLQAASGILVAMVMKLADNIIKTFSAAMSLLLSTLISMPVFGFQPNKLFGIGACMVLLSAHMYSGGSLPWPFSELFRAQCKPGDEEEKAKPHDEEKAVRLGAVIDKV